MLKISVILLCFRHCLHRSDIFPLSISYPHLSLSYMLSYGCLAMRTNSIYIVVYLYFPAFVSYFLYVAISYVSLRVSLSYSGKARHMG